MDAIKEHKNLLPPKKGISDLLPREYVRKKLTKRDKIKLLRVSLELGNILGVARREAGIASSCVIPYWKKLCNFDRIHRLIEAAKERGQTRRDDIVEDAQFRRLAMGTASGSEYEFYLTNRRGEAWKKIKENTVVMQNTTHLHTPPLQIIFESVKREAIDAI